MDLLRQAVGDQRLFYIGYSYGTFLGATYARLFPDRVGRFVLDATVDPVAWSGTGTGEAAPTTPLGIRIRQGIGADETFGEFSRLCRLAGPAGCALAALGDPADVVPALLDRLAVQPVEIPLPDGTTFEMTQQAAVSTIFESLYSPSVWPELAVLLAELAAPVHRGGARRRRRGGNPMRPGRPAFAGRTTPPWAGRSPACASTPRTAGASCGYPRLMDAAEPAGAVLRPVPGLVGAGLRVLADHRRRRVHAAPGSSRPRPRCW